MPRIAAPFNFSEMTPVQYDALIEDYKAAEAADVTLARERVIHVSMPKDGGIFIFDVWESAEALERLGAVLGPLLEKHGVRPARPTVYPVHNTLE
jgi:hypothetical protein